ADRAQRGTAQQVHAQEQQGADADGLRGEQTARVARRIAKRQCQGGRDQCQHDHADGQWTPASHPSPHPARGSRKSRTASPTRLSASTTTKMARPGSSATCGLSTTNWRPVASMLPQSAVGGWVPSPRNDNPAVANIFTPTSRLNATSTG